jgi:STE24 endopeptidase
MPPVSPRLFWLLVLAFFAARLALAFLSYLGDPRPETRERALRHFSAETLDRGFEYHRAGFPVALTLMLLTQAALLIFILSGASAGLAERCLAWVGGRVWAQPGLYLAVLMAVVTVATLPFDFYFGYVIEHRFGFSNLDVRGWLLLQAKSFAVGFPLTVAVGVAAYAVLRAFPRGWVVLVPAGALALQLTMTVLFPRLILPLFFKVQPVSDPELLAPLREVSAKAGVELQGVKLIDASRYSTKTNAFFTGFGRFKSVYLFDTLVKEHRPEEVAAVLAHELGHWRHGHVAKGIALSTAGLLAACLALAWAWPRIEATAWLHAGGIQDVASLPVLLLLASIGGFFASPLSSGVSRHFERQADAACLELTGERAVYIEGFKRLAEQNRAQLLPHPVVVWWRYSHPPVVERIERVAGAR